jgi:hypothetical protein
MATKSRPYPYELSGLPDVRLAGIKVWRCPRCRAEAPVLPRVAELHRLIALTLVMRERLLRGAEVRFLRVQGGFAAKDFAKLIGVDAAHLSRVENGKRRSLGRASDRLARTPRLRTAGTRALGSAWRRRSPNV